MWLGAWSDFPSISSLADHMPILGIPETSRQVCCGKSKLNSAGRWPCGLSLTPRGQLSCRV